MSDEYAGTQFHQNEASDAYAVTESYSVLLPDGQTQTVTYTADNSGYGGYVADVQYEGQAYAPQPAPHHPASVLNAFSIILIEHRAYFVYAF